MDLLTLLAAAEGAAESESAETPFYIVGSMLAGFAVIAAAIGLMRPNMGSAGAGAISGIGAILVVATMATILAIA
jgi:hypothetical protein